MCAALSAQRENAFYCRSIAQKRGKALFFSLLSALYLLRKFLPKAPRTATVLTHTLCGGKRRSGASLPKVRKLLSAFLHDRPNSKCIVAKRAAAFGRLSGALKGVVTISAPPSTARCASSRVSLSPLPLTHSARNARRRVKRWKANFLKKESINGRRKSERFWQDVSAKPSYKRRKH